MTLFNEISLQYRRPFTDGGVSIAEMLFRSNLLAVVGGGPIPKYPPNKVMIWDDHQQRPIAELPFLTPVRSVRLKNNRIAVALEQKVFLYDFHELRCLHSVETTPNSEGLLALSSSDESNVLACPGLHAGEVRIDILDTKKIKVIAAHDTPLSALALSHNGKYIATASEKGTLIRVFSTLDGVKVKELRRGSDPAKIYNLAFSIPTSATTACGGGDGGGSSGSGKDSNGLPEWLAVSSDKGTVHIFNLTGKSSSSSGASGSEEGWAEQQQLEERSGSGSGSSLGISPTKTGSGRLMMKSISSLTVRNLRISLTFWMVFCFVCFVENCGTVSKKFYFVSIDLLLQRFVPNKVGGAYLASERSWAQHRLPDNHKCIVAFGSVAGTLFIASVTGVFHEVAFDPEKKGPCVQIKYKVFMEEEE
jgi:WD repeat-containing protein 45